MINDEIYSTRKTLLEKIKNKHDNNSWEDFVFYYRKFIYIICRRMHLNHHDAEEIVQKVLLISWDKLPELKYNKKRKFRGWLFLVTKNTVRDFYKYTQRQIEKVQKASESCLNEDYSIPDIDEIAEQEWKAYIANMALDNIKDKFSETVIKVFRMLSQGQPRSAVAEKMNLPPNTVSVYKKRVSAKMHKEIRRLNLNFE